MKDTVLVTGAAGFIGRSVVKILLDRGYQVIGLDNFSFSNEDQMITHPDLAIEKGDTRDFKLMRGLVRRSDAVIHLAAPSSFIMHEENDLDACSFTMMGFKTLMEAIRAEGRRFPLVWASTSAVYEEWEKPPRVPFHEGLALDPPDSKAGCKHWCELEAQRYSNRYGIHSIAFRPFSVYGVGEHTKLGYANVTSLFTWAMMAGRHPVVWGDGKQTRDFIFVEDTARAFVMALESRIDGFVPLNLGFGVEHTFNQVIDIAAKQLDFSPRPVRVDVPIQIYAYRLWADTRRVSDFLGFTPAISLEEGIARIIDATKRLSPEWRRRLEMQQMYFEKLVKKPHSKNASAASS